MQRVRASRHNKPHTRERWYTETVECAPATPGAVRTVEDVNGELAVVYRVEQKVRRQAPVTEPFWTRAASGPTGTYGKKNAPPEGRPKPKKE